VTRLQVPTRRRQVGGGEGSVAVAQQMDAGSLAGATNADPPTPHESLPHASHTAAGIRLAGATHDVHMFDVRSGTWEKTTPQGEPPSPRAAHAATAVGNMVVIQVGAAFLWGLLGSTWH
jgi:protein phosphatase